MSKARKVLREAAKFLEGGSRHVPLLVNTSNRFSRGGGHSGPTEYEVKYAGSPVELFLNERVSYKPRSLKDAFKTLEFWRGDSSTRPYCPNCGTGGIDDTIEDIAKERGIKFRNPMELFGQILKNDEDLHYELRDEAEEKYWDAEDGVCYNCGYDYEDAEVEAHSYINDVIEGIKDPIVRYIKRLGGDPDVHYSGLSEACYIEFYDADDEERKIRIAAHESKPTYVMLHGESDFIMNIRHARESDIRRWTSNCLEWIKKAGVSRD